MFGILLDVAEWQRTARANGAHSQVWADLGHGRGMALVRVAADGAEDAVSRDALRRRFSPVRPAEIVVDVMDEADALDEEVLSIRNDAKATRRKHAINVVSNNPLQFWGPVLEAMCPMLMVSVDEDKTGTHELFRLQALVEQRQRLFGGPEIIFETWQEIALNRSWLRVRAKTVQRQPVAQLDHIVWFHRRGPPTHP